MLKNSKQLCCSCSISGIKKNLFASSLMIFKETEPNVSAHGAESQDQPYPEIQTLDDLKKARKTSEDADSNVDKSAADKNAITARAARNAINLFYDKVRETKKGSSLRRIWDKFRRWDRAQYWEKKRRIFKQGRKEAAQTTSKNLLVEKDKKYTLTTDVNLFNRHGRPIGILSKSDPENKTETKIQPLNTKILTVDGEEYIKVKVYKTKQGKTVVKRGYIPRSAVIASAKSDQPKDGLKPAKQEEKPMTDTEIAIEVALQNLHTRITDAWELFLDKNPIYRGATLKFDKGAFTLNGPSGSPVGTLLPFVELDGSQSIDVTPSDADNTVTKPLNTPEPNNEEIDRIFKDLLPANNLIPQGIVLPQIPALWSASQKKTPKEQLSHRLKRGTPAKPEKAEPAPITSSLRKIQTSVNKLLLQQTFKSRYSDVIVESQDAHIGKLQTGGFVRFNVVQRDYATYPDYFGRVEQTGNDFAFVLYVAESGNQQSPQQLPQLVKNETFKIDPNNPEAFPAELAKYLDVRKKFKL